ncbi:MAG: ROK family protein [Candidatus Eisenbacteria bacterium]|nr:ROK family protein [Candidatus Latescibacterota bacterium]MBD3302851.1 ROK family protein [Candidatus Eisenbacteria bacterium]
MSGHRSARSSASSWSISARTGSTISRSTNRNSPSPQARRRLSSRVNGRSSTFRSMTSRSKAAPIWRRSSSRLPTRGPYSWITSSSTARVVQASGAWRSGGGSRDLEGNRLWKGVRRDDPDRPRPLANGILRLIWEHKRMSRADIVQEEKLSRSTVSEVVGELLRTGLIAEVGIGQSRGGRRPVILEFQDDAAVILGVEMGATHVAVALTDLRGRVLAWHSRPHPVRNDPDGSRALVGELCDTCLTEAAAGRPLVGIGVALACPVDPSRPGEVSEMVLPAWEGRLGLEPLGRRLGVPLMVDNDANLGALAEHWWGVGRGIGNLAYVKVATGVGCGFVMNGDIYRGSTGVAGEIGHLAIAPQGKQCMCGLRGCLATVVGTPALIERTAELLAAHHESVLAGNHVTIEEIERAAIAGDTVARQVVTEAAEYLGIAVAGLLNLMNPAMVVLGGHVAGLGELVLGPIRETVRQRTLVSQVTAAELVTSKLGPQSIAIGAATMILKEALADCFLLVAVPGSGQAAS